MTFFTRRAFATVVLPVACTLFACGVASPGPVSSPAPSSRPTATSTPKATAKPKAGSKQPSKSSKNALTVSPDAGAEGTVVTLTYAKALAAYPQPLRAMIHDPGVHGWVVMHGAGDYVVFDPKKGLTYTASAKAAPPSSLRNAYTATIPGGICGIEIKPKQAAMTKIPVGFVQGTSSVLAIGQKIKRYGSTATKPTKRLLIWLAGQAGKPAVFGLKCDKFTLSVKAKAKPKKVLVPPVGTSNVTATLKVKGPAQFLNGKPFPKGRPRPTITTPIAGIDVWFHSTCCTLAPNPAIVRTNRAGKATATVSWGKKAVAVVQAVAPGLGDATAIVKFVPKQKQAAAAAGAAAAPAPIDKDQSFAAVSPAVVETPVEHPYLPRTAGPGSQIVATYIDPNQSGPSDAIVGIITADKSTHYYKTKTDTNHKLRFALPLKIGGALVTGLVLAQGLKENHEPDDNAARCSVGEGETVPNTDAISNAPSGGIAVTRGSSAYEQTPGRAIVDLQTRGANPLTAQLALDGNADQIDTRAASNTSIEGELHADTPLGRHRISVRSDDRESNAFPADIVRLDPQPLPPNEPGVEETLVVRCTGLGNDPATMAFDVSGPATLADGSNRTTVPVTDGVAQVRIRGTHSGAANVRFKLSVQIPGFWN